MLKEENLEQFPPQVARWPLCLGMIDFSRVGEWIYIMPLFQENHKRPNAEGHIKFHAHAKNFLRVFKKI